MLRFNLFLLINFLIVFTALAQTSYSSYDEAIDVLEEQAKQKGFKIIEASYDNNCKQLKRVEIADTQEVPNQYTGRMDVVFQIYYRYCGCYWCYDQYEGKSEIKASISKNSSGRFIIKVTGSNVLWTRVI